MNESVKHFKSQTPWFCWFGQSLSWGFDFRWPLKLLTGLTQKQRRRTFAFWGINLSWQWIYFVFDRQHTMPPNLLIPFSHRKRDSVLSCLPSSSTSESCLHYVHSRTELQDEKQIKRKKKTETVETDHPKNQATNRETEKKTRIERWDRDSRPQSTDSSTFSVCLCIVSFPHCPFHWTCVSHRDRRVTDIYENRLLGENERWSRTPFKNLSNL